MNRLQRLSISDQLPGTSLTVSGPDHRRTYEKPYVRGLFDSIAHRYDLLNHLLSSGIDVFWRRKAISLLAPLHPSVILDVATGTGDLAFEAVRLQPARIIGIDISPAMLDRARQKSLSRNLDHVVRFVEADAEHLPFPDGEFDAATVAFGVRNFSDLSRGLGEMARVLRPGGAVMILEFSRPRSAPVNRLYSWYSGTILPAVGGWISRNREAYEYLPGTIREFPDGEDFLSILRKAGFTSVARHPLTFGIASIYTGTKPPF